MDISQLAGVASHFLHNEKFYPGTGPYWEVSQILPHIKRLGVTNVAEGVYALGDPRRALIIDGKNSQSLVAAHRKQVSDWLSLYDKAGMKICLALLGLPPSAARAAENNRDFAAWTAELIAAHPSVTSVQLHNEPNLRSFWRNSTPEQYADTYRDYAAQIKAKRPDVKILVGATSSLWWAPGIEWLSSAAKHGLFDYADGVAVHPYNLDLPPETDPHWRSPEANGPLSREKAILAYADKIKELAGRPLPLYFTEFGWNTASSGVAHVTEQEQADYLVRSLFIFMNAKALGAPLEKVYWYDLKDDGDNPDKDQHRYGLLKNDLSGDKPSFTAYKNLLAGFKPFGPLKHLDRPSLELACGSDSKVMAFATKDGGTEILVAWSTEGTSTGSSCEAKRPSPSVAVSQISLDQLKGNPLFPGEAVTETVKLSATPVWFVVRR